jgi:hypothetical protein
MDGLDFLLESLDAVPEPLRQFYVERKGGGFQLKVKGVAPKSEVDQFRETNIRLMKERDEINKRYEGIDPDAARRLAQELDQLKTGNGEALKPYIDRHLAAERDAHGAEKKTLQEKLAQALAAREKLAGVVGRHHGLNALRGALSEAKIAPSGEGAIEDLYLRFERSFSVNPETGEVLPRESPDGAAPLGVKSWLQKRLVDPLASHLFAQGEGGAGRGAGRPPANTEGKKVYTKAQLLAPTPQMLEEISAGNVVVAD